MNQSIKRSRHPHPAMKWTALVGFVAVLVLGVPGRVAASVPNVKPPVGPSTNGYFTGAYSFDTYIYCQNGLTFTSSYSNSLEGTHTFNFDGADDGSLLVRIDGGGDLILYSCGDPTPTVVAASYVVTKDTVAPSASITSPANGSSTSASSIDVAVAAGDSTSGVGSVSVNGIAASNVGGTWHATVGLSVGSNNVSANVMDRAGHTAGDLITVTRTASSGGGGSTGGGSTGGNTGGNTGGGTTGGRTSGGGSFVPAPAPSGPAQTPDPTPAPTPVASGVVPTATPTPIPVSKGAIATPSPKPAASGMKMPAIPWMMVLKLISVGLTLVILLGLWFGVPTVRRSLIARLNIARIRLSPYLFRFRMVFRAHGHDLPRRGALAHHKHTGKVLASHHTSYPMLIFLVLFTGVLTAAVSVSSHADSGSSSSTLSLTVLGPAPTNPAFISSPVDGTTVTSSTVVVRGTCPIGLVVEVYRNGGFAGSSICDGSGLFQISITVSQGINTLVARDVDGLGQYGPDSNIVRVGYGVVVYPSPTPRPSTNPGPARRPPVQVSPAPTPPPAVPPLTLDTNQHYLQGIEPGQAISWKLKIIGGQPPFQVTWNWGDSKSDSLAQADRESTSPQHVYKDAGFYHITATVRDSSGQTALIQLLVVVNGTHVPGGIHSKPDFGYLIPIWPLLAAMLLLVTCYWLGEKTFKDQHPQPQPAANI